MCVCDGGGGGGSGGGGGVGLHTGQALNQVNQLFPIGPCA